MGGAGALITEGGSIVVDTFVASSSYLLLTVDYPCNNSLRLLNFGIT